MKRTPLPSIFIDESIISNRYQPLDPMTDAMEKYKAALINNALNNNYNTLRSIINDFLLKKNNFTRSDKMSYTADIINNYKDQNGNNLFLLAVLSNKIEIAMLLLQSGANINSRNYQGETALSSVRKHDARYCIIEQWILSKNPVTSPIRRSNRQPRSIHQHQPLLITTSAQHQPMIRSDSFAPIAPPLPPRTDLEVLINQRDFHASLNQNRSVLPIAEATKTINNAVVNEPKPIVRIPTPPPKNTETSDANKNVVRQKRRRLLLKSCPNHSVSQFSTYIGTTINDQSSHTIAENLPLTETLKKQ